MFFELCSPANGCSVKVPPLYFSIFVPLYIESLYSHTVQWTFQLELGNMCGQPILPPIQLKRHDNIQQRAPLENTVMQIASSDIFPALNKESSPKVSSSRTGEHDQHHRSWLPFSFFSFAIRYISWLTSQWILELLVVYIVLLLRISANL